MKSKILFVWVLGAVLAGSGMAGAGQPVPDYVKTIVAKTAALGTNGYPISFWNYNFLWIKENFEATNEQAVKEWADAGITVAQSPRYNLNHPQEIKRMHELLDWCAKYRLKLIILDKRTEFPGDVNDGKATWADYEKRVKEAIAEFGNHPALFGFHAGDEPDARAKDTSFEAVRRLKSLAPNLHPFANLLPYWGGMEKQAGANSWPEYLDEYARKGQPDFVCYDCYRQMDYSGGEGINIYYDNLRLHREAMIRNAIPFWNSPLSSGHYSYRHPTRDELRWQFHTSIAFGAKGVCWFFWYHPYPEANCQNAPYDDFFNKTPTYYDLYDIQKRFQKRYGKVINKLVSTRVTFSGTPPLGGCQAFTPNGLVAAVGGGPILVGEFVDPDGKRYVMLVNLKMEGASRMQVTFTGKDARYFSYSWLDGSEIEGRPGETSVESIGETKDGPLGPLVDHFAYPGQMVLYRVESKAANAEPIPVR